MRIGNQLWNDECGLVLSAEAVTIGTLGVMGAVVGLNAASTAVDQELKEFASAIRSLDQSYGFVGHQSCRAWSAGSCYRQQDVRVSLQELCAEGATDIRAIEQHVEAQRNAHLPAAPHPEPDADHVTPPAPNQIPVPELKTNKPQDAAPSEKSPEKSPKKKTKKAKQDDD